MSDIKESETAQDPAKTLKAQVLSRRGKLSVCTKQINEIRPMIKKNVEVGEVEGKLKALLLSNESFKSSHDDVQSLFLDEEVESDTEWFNNKMQEMDDFFKEVDVWKQEQNKLQSTVQPRDSISNASRTSRVSSAAKLALAEKAALDARSKTLPALQALQMEEAELKIQREMEERSLKLKRDMEEMALKSKRERLELQAQLDEANAKLKALRDAEELGDAMDK